MSACQAIGAAFLLVYLIGCMAAMDKATNTWGITKWYAYVAVVPLCAIWPLIVTAVEVSKIYEGENSSPEKTGANQ